VRVCQPRASKSVSAALGEGAETSRALKGRWFHTPAEDPDRETIAVTVLLRDAGGVQAITRAPSGRVAIWSRRSQGGARRLAGPGLIQPGAFSAPDLGKAAASLGTGMPLQKRFPPRPVVGVSRTMFCK
jgi:hypothetical protein